MCVDQQYTEDTLELRRYLRRRSGFNVLNYTDIIEKTMGRYNEFLDAIESDKGSQ